MENPACDSDSDIKSNGSNNQSHSERNTATESLPGSAEISLKRIYQDTWSTSGTDSQDESCSFPERIMSNHSMNDKMSESQNSAINGDGNCRQSGEDASEKLIPEKVETVQPYATSNIAVIDQSTLESAYQNPYLNMYETIQCVHETTTERGETHVYVPDNTTSPSLSRSQSTKSKHPGIYTRQLNMFIGEEWEAMPWPGDRKALSCPGTLRASPAPTRHTPHLSTDNRRIAMLQQQVRREPPSYLNYLNASPEETPIAKHYIIKPNPHNRINHMIHSALHCPCFFFFYLLCCLPGVHYMQLGDIEYRTGHEDRAKRFGCVATALYAIGTIIGTVTLATMVVLSVNFVQLQVQ